MGTLLIYICSLAVKRASACPVLLLTLLLLAPPPLMAQPVEEYHVKAVFLSNLRHFVNWPAASEKVGENFIIGILGPDPFGPILDKAVIGEKKNNRPVTVKRYTDLEELIPGKCNILFIHPSKIQDWAVIRQHLSGSPVLTVADVVDFPEQGGMVNLLKTGTKIQVEINYHAVQESRLSMSSKLLNLARIVQ